MKVIRDLIVLVLFKIILVYCDPVTDLIRSSGYDAEKHRFTTEDGYVLTVHRIPPKESVKNPEVIILMHGILGSSADYVVSGRKRSLASVLHDEGYDVWLPNARGNRWSRAHRRADISDKDFYNFSWHEIGTRDLPAVIDGIMAKTGAKKVHYTGHSQGSTVFLVLLTERPEYNDKIASAYLLSPIAFFTNFKNPLLSIVVENLDVLEKTVVDEGLYELFSYDTPSLPLAQMLCGPFSPFMQKCVKITYKLVGPSAYPYDRDVMAKILHFEPAGCSSKQVVHFAQLVRSGKFQQFDYGTEEKNLQKYKSRTPPMYNLKNIKIPLNLYYGSNDLLQAVEDAVQLKNKISHTASKSYEIQGFNHIDFVFSPYATKLIYKKIASSIKKSATNNG